MALVRIPAGQTEKLLQAEFHSAYYTMEIYQLPARLGGKFLLFAISDCNNSVFAKTVNGSLPHAAADFLLELTEQSPVRVRAVSKRIESWGIPELGLFMIHDAAARRRRRRWRYRTIFANGLSRP